MVKIYNSITELVGHTPLLRLGRLTTKLRLNVEILAKCEMYNPLFSVKDRVALAMIEQEEKKGISKDTVKKSIIIENSRKNAFNFRIKPKKRLSSSGPQIRQRFSEGG